MSKEKENVNVNKFLGMPMQWKPKEIFKTVWNKEDERLFPPKAFGIGWTVNFYAALKKLGLIHTTQSKNKDVM